MSAVTGRLSAMCARRPWVVIGVWLVLLIVAGLFARHMGDVVNSNHQLYFTPESAKGSQLLEQRMRGPAQAQEVVIVQSPDRTVDDAGFPRVHNAAHRWSQGARKAGRVGAYGLGAQLLRH